MNAFPICHILCFSFSDHWNSHSSENFSKQDNKLSDGNLKLTPNQRQLRGRTQKYLNRRLSCRHRRVGSDKHHERTAVKLWYIFEHEYNSRHFSSTFVLPSSKGLQSTLGDGPDRMHWRSKQVMDYVFMLYYSQGLAQYYLQLEDDVTVVPNALSQIREFIDLKGDTKWGILAFSRWGFIGKLIHDNDLRLIGRYLEMFYNEMPCDWLLYIYLQSRGAINILDDKSNTWTKELFLHVGHQSSSLGT